MSSPSVPFDWPLLAIMALFAFFGGIVRELRAASIKKKDLVDYITEGLVGAFTGMVVASLMIDYVSETHLLFGVAGLAGYFGPIMLDLLKEPLMGTLYRIMGAPVPPKSPPS